MYVHPAASQGNPKPQGRQETRPFEPPHPGDTRMEEPSTEPVPDSKPAQEQAAKAEPSGYRGDNPSTAGPGPTGIRSATPENSGGSINPSAPGDTGTTPGTTPQR